MAAPSSYSILVLSSLARAADHLKRLRTATTDLGPQIFIFFVFVVVDVAVVEVELLPRLGKERGFIAVYVVGHWCAKIVIKGGDLYDVRNARAWLAVEGGRHAIVKQQIVSIRRCFFFFSFFSPPSPFSCFFSLIPPSQDLRIRSQYGNELAIPKCV